MHPNGAYVLGFHFYKAEELHIPWEDAAYYLAG